jgi:hypothetical protein
MGVVGPDHQSRFFLPYFLPMVSKERREILEDEEAGKWLEKVQPICPNFVVSLKYVVNLPTDIVRVLSFQNTMVSALFIVQVNGKPQHRFIF